MSAVWEEAVAEYEQQESSARVQNSMKIEREDHKLEKRLCREVGRAIVDFNMIEEGDKVMVCVSGGKDSYSLLDILIELRERAPIEFEIVAVNLDQKQPGFPAQVLPAYLAGLGVDYRIVEQDVEQRVRVLAAGQADHHAIAVLDHAEVFDRLADLAAQPRLQALEGARRLGGGPVVGPVIGLWNG